MTHEATQRYEVRLPALTIAVLPATAAYDFESVASRIHDRDLLRGSVALRVFRIPLLAVPVGGCRRGGRIETSSVAVALAIRAALRDIPGFPLVRVDLALPVGTDRWLVEWGEKPPDLFAGHRERLRFYGYAANAEMRRPERSLCWASGTPTVRPEAPSADHQFAPDLRNQASRGCR
ncbi:DUF6302 family protein [Streptomyces sp. CBMA29]|uniref:DUF6302 family protein n=1 Tax=Streptomyces sp. CBMA29 TaxID=1896314 RepID=UPI001661D70A|nr:DUF6302 family protein [Streptomyces sp. CBMA29]MBD0739074.1 hypothetical protein [Streptomyces sp. CBMA29]